MSCCHVVRGSSVLMKELPPLPLFLLLAVSGGDSHEVDSQLICSHQPVVALAGEDVILPCRLEPPMGPGAGRVLWSKPGLNSKFILVYHQGRMIREEQNPAYEKRTFLFEDQLKDGNVSLKLSGVKVSDKGTYVCTHEAAVKTTNINLTVAAVSSVFISNVTMKTGEGVLPCQSSGWFPQPEMMFLDQDGNQVPASPTETAQGPDDLYSVRRTAVVDRPGNFTCRVHLKDFNQTRAAAIFVPEFVFVGNVLCVSLLVLGAAALATGSLISLETDRKKCDHRARKFSSWTVHAVLTAVVVYAWAAMLPRRHTFKDGVVFFLLMSCLTVALAANLATASIALVRKVKGGLLRYPLPVYWVLIYFVLLLLLLLVHIVAPLLHTDFYSHPFPVFWTLSAAQVVLITDVFVIIVTLFTCCHIALQETLRQVFITVFCTNRSSASAESSELTTRTREQQPAGGASASAGEGVTERLTAPGRREEEEEEEEQQQQEEQQEEEEEEEQEEEEQQQEEQQEQEQEEQQEEEQQEEEEEEEQEEEQQQEQEQEQEEQQEEEQQEEEEEEEQEQQQQQEEQEEEQQELAAVSSASGPAGGRHWTRDTRKSQI